MGREIRKVRKGWEHPTDDNGEYKPMHEEYYGDAVAEWINNHQLWLKGEHPDQKKDSTVDYKFYAEWDGDCPDIEYYNKEKWTEEEACCFQMYETVSEGTPVSPVFDTLDELEVWIIENLNYSKNAAHQFCQSGYAPSFITMGGVVKDGIEVHDGFE